MAPTECLLDTTIGLSLFSANRIPQEWNSLIKCTNLPRLCTMTMSSISPSGKILFPRQIGDQQSCVSSEIVLALAVDIQPGASSIDRFIRGIFLGERKSSIMVLAAGRQSGHIAENCFQNWCIHCSAQLF